MKTVLILEDNEGRIADFEKAVPQLGDSYELKIRRALPEQSQWRWLRQWRGA